MHVSDTPLKSRSIRSSRVGLVELSRMCWKTARPHQWCKNLIVFAPVLFAQKIHQVPALLATTECFVVFCLIASATYFLNDTVDRDADKLHPHKRSRPLACGIMTRKQALIMFLALNSLGIVLSYVIRPSLLLLAFTYIVTTLTYSLRLKSIALLDVLLIAAGFLIRAIAGAVSVNVPVSTWFLLCTTLGAVFLALEKRRYELQALSTEAIVHRKSLNGYSLELIDRLESVVLPVLLTCYVLYSFQSVHGQWMMLTIPFVLYGIMRYQSLSAGSSPEQVFLKDRPIQTAIILWLACSAAVIYGHLPAAITRLFSFMESLPAVVF